MDEKEIHRMHCMMKQNNLLRDADERERFIKQFVPCDWYVAAHIGIPGQEVAIVVEAV